MSSSLPLTEVMAQRLHRALIASPVPTIDDVYAHPAVAGLHRETVGRVVDRLVADGRVTDDECGRLIVAPMRTETVA